MNNLELVAFTDKTIGFYFDGGFLKMIQDADLDSAEIEQWAKLAFIYFKCKSFINADSALEKNNLLMLLEDLIVTAEVEIMSGGNLRDISLLDIGNGYDIDAHKYIEPLQLAYEFMLDKGIDFLGAVNEELPTG